MCPAVQKESQACLKLLNETLDLSLRSDQKLSVDSNGEWQALNKFKSPLSLKVVCMDTLVA